MIMKDNEKVRTKTIEKNVINIPQDDNDDDVRKKKKNRMHMSKTEATNVDGKKNNIKKSQTDEKLSKIKPAMFQRFFSKEDKISIHQCLLDYTFMSGRNMFDNMDDFYDYVKLVINFNASKKQLVTKVWNLKRKYKEKSLKKEYAGEEEVLLCDDTDKKTFELLRKICGNDCVWPPKQGKLFEKHGLKKWKNQNHPISYGRDITSFVKTENASSLDLDENASSSFVKAETASSLEDDVEDDPKKKEIVEKFKK